MHGGTEFARKIVSYSVFLPRTHRSLSLIRREKLLQIPIHDPEQDRGGRSPSVRHHSNTQPFTNIQMSLPESVDVCLAGKDPPVLRCLKHALIHLEELSSLEGTLMDRDLVI